MYTKQIPFKDFNGKPRNATVHFNLTEREVFKLLPELKFVTEWRASMEGPERELSSEEVVPFYNAFEEILLTAYGVPSDDGLYFRKSSRYDFEDSALFAACMLLFVSDPEETGRMIEAIMPKNMEEHVKKASENLDAAVTKSGDEELRREVARLRARLGGNEGSE